jgi:hypothetical protein
MDETLTLRVTYLRPGPNLSGTFLVCREDVPALAAWRAAHGITTRLATLPDPKTGERLPALRPVEGRQLLRVEQQRRIRHGQRCRVTYAVRPIGDRPAIWFVDVEPLEGEAG